MGTKSLMECKTLNQVASLKRDNFSSGDFDLMSDGQTVWLGEQPIGELPKQKISIPKRTFDALIRRYIKQQEISNGNY